AERRPDDAGRKADDADTLKQTLSRRRRRVGAGAFGQPRRGLGEVAANLNLMLAQKRRAARDLPWTFRKSIGVARKVMAAEMGMVHAGDKMSVLRLLIGEKRARRIDRRRRQPQALKLLEKLLGFVIERAGFDQTIDNLAQRKTVLHHFEFGVEQFRRAAEPLDEPAPVIRLVDEDARITVPALVGLRHGSRLAMAGALGNLARHAVPCDDA